jgi:tetratricopeptide (TPR) repeat protein
MIPCLYWYFEVHGYYAEALMTYQHAIDSLQSAGAPDNLLTSAEKSTFAFLIDQLGWFSFRTGDLASAVVFFEKSLKLANEHNDPDVLFHIYGNWGYLALLNGDISEADRLTTRSLEYAQKLNSPWHIAIPTNVLGIVNFQAGRLDKAYQQLTDNLRMWRAVGDPRGLVFCMLYLGAAGLALGKLEPAEAILLESNSIAKNKMDHWALAFGLDLLGQLHLVRGNHEEAGKVFRQSLDLSQNIGDQWGSTQTLIHLGESLAHRDFTSDVRRLFINAYHIAQQSNWIPTILEVLIAYISRDETLPSETRLSVILAVLQHSYTSTLVRTRAEHLSTSLLIELDDQRVKEITTRALQTSPEDWAKQIFDEPPAGDIDPISIYSLIPS